MHQAGVNICILGLGNVKIVWMWNEGWLWLAEGLFRLERLNCDECPEPRGPAGSLELIAQTNQGVRLEVRHVAF